MSAARLSIPFFAAVVSTGACGSSDDDVAQVDAGGPSGSACEASAHVGYFEVRLADGYTAVQGQVSDGVTPFLVPEVVGTDGPCRHLEPPDLFCDPACDPGTTCDESGNCIPIPSNVSVGVVTVTGLKSPVEMTARAPVFYYTNTGTLEHPGFDEGDHIHLSAGGEGDVAAFTLAGRGIAVLVMPEEAVPLTTDEPAVLSWTPPGQDGLGSVHVNLNIAQHGGTPGWIECEVPDTGNFTIPVGLTNSLLSQAYSGFPSVTITRRSADATNISAGCVDFFVESHVTLAIEIPGLISCSGPDDCPPGQTCLPDLTCG